MCGGYMNPEGWQELRLPLKPTDLEPAPGRAVRPFDAAPIVLGTGDGEAELVRADQWSLIPFFAREKRLKYSTFNARLDKLRSSKVWSSVFPAQRCLVPAAGFFERVPEPGAPKKRPFYVQFRDRRAFCFAGLWNRWRDPKGEQDLLTYTVITTEPNALMKGIGHPRMPCIVPPEQAQQWLDPDHGDADDLVASVAPPAPASELECWPVSHAINFRGRHGSELTEPVGEPQRTEGA